MPEFLWSHWYGEPREETVLFLPGPAFVIDTYVRKSAPAHTHVHISQPCPQPSFGKNQSPHLLPACRGEAQFLVVVCSQHLPRLNVPLTDLMHSPSCPLLA